MSREKRTELLQLAGYGAFAIIALALIQSGFFDNLTGSQFALANYPNSGNNFTAILSGILIFAAEILKILVVLGVIIGSYMVLKNFFVDNKLSNCSNQASREEGCYKCPTCGNSLSEEFKYCPSCKTPLKHKCSCGKEVQENWKCCPHCGKGRE